MSGWTTEVQSKTWPVFRRFKQIGRPKEDISRVITLIITRIITRIIARIARMAVHNTSREAVQDVTDQRIIFDNEMAFLYNGTVSRHMVANA